MSESFGARLRYERERRKIALDTIAVNTKILPALLEGLERDDLSRWPSGIFRRSFVRAYAQAVGLDPDETVREFLNRYPEPADVGADPQEQVVARVPSGGRYDGLRLTLGSAALRFAGCSLMSETRRRLAAIAFDAGALTVLGLGLFLALGRFWAPMAVSSSLYYFMGILALGNTPGVCLFAERSGDHSAAQRSPSVPP